jgi:hypothetical protein
MTSFSMATKLLFVTLTALAAQVVRADTCSYIEAFGYIEVTRALNLAYIEEQTQYW